MRKCIGCDKKSKERLCKKCKEKLTMLFKVLKDNDIELKLESVKINRD